MTEPYVLTEGTTPLLITCPHPGTAVPEDIVHRFTDEARPVPDTDWHVDRLYDFAAGLGASLLVASWSRYVVDLNRDPAGRPLYPGAENTEICPTRTFDQMPIYRDGAAPDGQEVKERVERYWRPYHERLQNTLAALRERHGIAVLFDAHSIRSQVPRFFPGKLPDLNFGTARGVSCDRELAAQVFEVLQGGKGYSSVRDGRFTGGYITRTYGQPANRVHAMQLEIAQLTYMEEKPPFRYRPDLAQRLKPVLRQALETVLRWTGTAAV